MTPGVLKIRQVSYHDSTGRILRLQVFRTLLQSKARAVILDGRFLFEIRLASFVIAQDNTEAMKRVVIYYNDEAATGLLKLVETYVLEAVH